jgi:hypothetical protein
LDILQDLIEESIMSSDAYDRCLYDMPRAALYLAWFGLTEQQTLDLLKSDVLDDGVIVDGTKIPVPPSVASALIQCRDSDGYYMVSRGVRMRPYKPTEYLMRSWSSPRLTPATMRTMITNLNNIMDKRYSLTYNVVRQSGIFYRAFMLECNSKVFDFGDKDFMRKVFCCKSDSNEQIRRRLKAYDNYKQLFQ